MSPTARLALDFGPLAAFFTAYQLYHPDGMLIATGVLIVATFISLLIGYILERKLHALPIITGVMVGIFGGATLLLQDELFIKIKPTVLNLLFAVLLIGGEYFKKPTLKYVMGTALPMQDEGWSKLTLRWGWFFVFLAGLNEVIWRNFSTDFWVDFKVFGMFTLTMLFTFAQIPLMKKYMIDDEPTESAP